MEPKMISLKVLCTTAAMALALPTASFAQSHPIRGGGGVHVGGGGAHAGGGGWHGGGWHGGGGGWHGGGFIPGAVAGAIVGGAIASAPYGYYGGPGYYAPGYYDEQYYDDQGPVVAGPPDGGGDAVAYCMQTYRSYDPRSGTYLGNDGYRHPCP
jgi:hypothetical protein